MNINRGKKFEQVVRDAIKKVPDTFVLRLHDQTTGYRGTSANICDFVVYRQPALWLIECKSVHGNILPFTNISDNQWQGLLEASKVLGIKAGIICWWVNHDITRFIPISQLETLREAGKKSIRYDDEIGRIIDGKKRKIFFNYDMEGLLNDLR